MPDERRAEERIGGAKADEMLGLMDKLFELSGQPSFTSMLGQLQGEIVKQASEFEKEGLTENDVKAIADHVPDLMAETVSQTFSLMAESMKDAIQHPDKLKDAMLKHK